MGAEVVVAGLVEGFDFSEHQYNNIRINMCDIKENVDIFQSFEEYIKDIQGT